MDKEATGLRENEVWHRIDLSAPTDGDRGDVSYSKGVEGCPDPSATQTRSLAADKSVEDTVCAVCARTE